MKFEVVTAYLGKEINLPIRKTKGAAGYDFEVAQDTVIPSYHRHVQTLRKGMAYAEVTEPATLQEVAGMTKWTGAKPTLVPTGIKCKLDDGYYLELSVRSSCPLKHWLVLANGVGIIDADYYNNPDNEGAIYFQLINLYPYDILLQKGDIIGQGIIKKYEVTEDDTADGVRLGGFGSTSKSN